MGQTLPHAPGGHYQIRWSAVLQSYAHTPPRRTPLAFARRISGAAACYAGARPAAHAMRYITLSLCAGAPCTMQI
jgi:hypothetical protein